MKRVVCAALSAVLFAMSAVAGPDAAAAVRQGPRPNRFGICSHLMWQYPAIHSEDAGKVLNLCAKAGIGQVRSDFFWDQMKRPDGSFDFSAADRLVDEARTKGVAFLATLADKPGRCEILNGRLEAWCEYVRDWFSRLMHENTRRRVE